MDIFLRALKHCNVATPHEKKIPTKKGILKTMFAYCAGSYVYYLFQEPARKRCKIRSKLTKHQNDVNDIVLDF